ncbi:hypothetical protein CHS0354_010289 [Potamilus streckersoni]|uniref:Box C/D snoRNA protein 1 n=1 Tax=Potamilus streckersoni TaxID=2493646 RepID=A0AAE0WAX1_9BIVA|nr:hypothetical protein CHS0354_010289 [Potamilus streckersoni]
MQRCEICKENAAKYKCPRCLAQTCSLSCVKHHKAEASCNGQRDKSKYVALKDFSDLHLLSDYRFLEDVGRKTSNCHRDLAKRRHNKPKFLQELQKQASRRNIDLRLMPFPMSKRKNNFTTYHYKSRSILWQIEWLFPQAEARYIGKRIPDTSTLQDLLKKYVDPVESDPVIRQNLQCYIRENFHLFMKAEKTKDKNARYHKLSIEKTLTENLAHKCVIEYPTIHVVLGKYCNNYPLIDTEDKDSAQRTQHKQH